MQSDTQSGPSAGRENSAIVIAVTAPQQEESENIRHTQVSCTKSRANYDKYGSPAMLCLAATGAALHRLRCTTFFQVDESSTEKNCSETFPHFENICATMPLCPS